MSKREVLIGELLSQAMFEQDPKHKDIIIIIHDQQEYVEKCINSVFANTKNFTLYLWDNASQRPTAEYLESLAANHENIVLIQNPANIGFIEPNNILVEKGSSPYVILLNSDTEVQPGWDTALLGWLENHPNVAEVGYAGGILTERAEGHGHRGGSAIDYLSGWCMAFSRKIYEQFGLFDSKNLTFAYGEDSDFSLRLKSAGYEIYALHLDLVLHHSNKTIAQVEKETDVKVSFNANHDYLRQRWGEYLAKERVEVRQANSQNVPSEPLPSLDIARWVMSVVE